MAQENKSVYNGVFKWNDDEKELLIDEFGEFQQITSQFNNLFPYVNFRDGYRKIYEQINATG